MRSDCGPGDKQCGQAIIEMVLIIPILLTLLFSLVDVGRYTDRQVSLEAATRDGTRYAITHPHAYNSSSSAPADSIQGVTQSEGGGATIINDDTHLTLQYQDNSGASATPCANYKPSTGLTYVGAYGPTTCLVPGNLIVVTTKYQYTILAPPFSAFFPNGVTMTATFTMVEMS
jgi:Flp pilus assembly protein TadG